MWAARDPVRPFARVSRGGAARLWEAATHGAAGVNAGGRRAQWTLVIPVPRDLRELLGAASRDREPLGAASHGR